MLVLTRKPMQQIRIGDEITITVVKVERNAIRIAIEAPRDVHILRGELTRFEQSARPSTALATRTSHSTVESAPDGLPSSPESKPLHALARRRDIPAAAPLADRLDRTAPRAPSHPLRWTVASMRQRTESTTASTSTTPSVPGQTLRANRS